jgi:23S rRNA G2069 N7-methylase RlmK/C1962 C5-methylase RlmI
MENKKLGNDWKNSSLSHATMITEDVFNNITEYFPEDERIQGMIEEFNKMKEEGQTEDQEYICWEILFDYLNQISPDNCYFGAHPGDGSDYGFWEDEEITEE